MGQNKAKGIKSFVIMAFHLGNWSPFKVDLYKFKRLVVWDIGLYKLKCPSKVTINSLNYLHIPKCIDRCNLPRHGLECNFTSKF